MPTWKLGLVQVGFALMVPVGITAFYLASEVIAENQLVGFALAFSSGAFILIALSDLLPEVQFHRHNRVGHFSALLFGIVLMGGIALLEGHKHGEPETAGKGHGEGDHHHHDD